MILTPFTAALWAIFLICATVAVVARIRGRVHLGLGLRWPQPWRALGAGTSIGAAAIGLVFAAGLARGGVTVSSVGLHAALLGHALAFFIPWALFEEVALRCLLLVGVLVISRRPWVALLASAIVFGLAHAPNPDATTLSIASATLGGAMYALAFLRTGRIWLPLSLHLAWNLSQAALGFPVSGVTSYSTLLVTQAHHGGAWWITGGAYGPEAGPAGIVARLVVIVLILAVTRKRQPSPLLIQRTPEIPGQYATPPVPAR